MVNAGGFRFGRPGHAGLLAMWAEAVLLDLSYGHVGSTIADSALPASGRAIPNVRGTRRVFRQFEIPLGEGADCFELARDSLRGWSCHRGIGASIFAELAPIQEGQTVLVCIPVGLATLVVPNRIVQVVNEAHRFGFAYGTLIGHQERGEESFVVEQDSHGGVIARITVDSCPGTWITRVAGPAAGLLQRVAIRRYLGSLREDVARRSTSRGE